MMDTRKIVLETLIELAVAGKHSLTIGIDAHALLTGKPLEGAYKNQQLADLYPEFVPEKPKAEQYLDEISKGKERPISIWHLGDAISYYEATDADRDAWNAYAQHAADAFDSDPRRDSYDTTAVFAGVNRDGKVTSWCPPLYFPEWLVSRKEKANG